MHGKKRGRLCVFSFCLGKMPVHSCSQGLPQGYFLALQFISPFTLIYYSYSPELSLFLARSLSGIAFPPKSFFYWPPSVKTPSTT